MSEPSDGPNFDGNRSSDGMPDALQRARHIADAEGDRWQDMNRIWWEELPMTYAEWSSADRTPRSRADFEAIRQALFGNSPFLREHYDFGARKGERVLDLGCGSGVTACAFAEKGASVVAVDLTQKAIDITRDAASAWGVSLGLARVDAESMSFAEGAFDYVFSWGVLHHSRDTEKAFSEVNRVLKPGGNGLVMVYHKNSLIYYLKGLSYLIFKGKLLQGHTLRSVQRFFTDGYYHRHFTRTSLRDALADSGVVVTRVLVTQMQKKILPAIPDRLDRYLKARIGWLLVAEFEKPASKHDTQIRP